LNGVILQLVVDGEIQSEGGSFFLRPLSAAEVVGMALPRIVPPPPVGEAELYCTNCGDIRVNARAHCKECGLCGSSHHFIRGCPVLAALAEARDASVNDICYHCGVPGHGRRKCENLCWLCRGRHSERGCALWAEMVRRDGGLVEVLRGRIAAIKEAWGGGSGGGEKDAKRGMDEGRERLWR
jgi:hypothetical protein